MHTIHTSSRLESLCQALAERTRKPGRGVFGKEVIITQAKGMDEWLKTELARRNGVFANFAFQNQDGFFAGIYQLLFGERLGNTTDSVKYKIYGCLGGSDFQGEFKEVAEYYENSDLRRIQLAARIADLFDQYQLYRPEMIEKWESGSLSTENPAEGWQRWLWNRLGIESRAAVKLKILEGLGIHSDLIKKTYPQISLFGISVFTQFHLDFFKALGEYTQVDFYLCLPTDHEVFHNELLLSFGTKAGELASMFDLTDFTASENEGDTLLSRIQNQIVRDSSDLDRKGDDSVQVNSCYTPIREAECLYNYLLDLFGKDKGLKPGDVLVMATDINKYAPFIKAVFRNAPINIPFQVSGTANNSDGTMVSALEQILLFTEEDLTSEKVISLLEQKRISKRFGIQDCGYVRSAVHKANIRFGSKNSTKDDTRYVSWKYGLQKILMGYAMLTDEEYTLGDGLSLYPFKDAEGSGSYDLLRLKAFVEKLESVILAQKEIRTLAAWKLFLCEEVIEKMVFCDDFVKDDRAELSSIYSALSFVGHLEWEEEISWAVFLEELKARLFTEARSSKINTGRVTVSSPIPVRGLPFRVICFLGLNNDVFPRKDQFMGFDLLGEKYRTGDRNKKETDKYLFLDTLLAAREKLYLSYTGQSAKDNTEVPPSIVVDTLLDYLGPDMLVVKHPLHGFSARYQQDDKRLFTYLYSETAETFPPKETEHEGLSDISVYSFVKFFEHPIEWYFNTVLGIKYEEDDDTLPETELFELDHLQKWMVKSDLLKVSDGELEPYLQKGIKEGALPLRNLGKAVLDELFEETVAIRTIYQALTGGKDEQNIVVDLNIGSIRITGSINGVYEKRYIAYSLSKSPEKDRVRAYLKTLFLCAMDKISDAQLLGKDGDSMALPVFLPDEAKIKINELLAYLVKGRQSPLKFTLKAACPNKNSVCSIGTVLEAFREEANGTYLSDPNKYMQVLDQEGYFAGFEEADLDELKIITGLLNLNIA